MNLLYTITAYPPSIGGAQFYAHMLAKSLISKNIVNVVSFWDTHRTDWLLGTTLRAPQCHVDYDHEGIPVHRIGISIAEKLKIAPNVFLYYPFMGAAIPGIAKCIQKHLEPYTKTVDLIHNVRIGREPISYASMYAAIKRDIPFVFTPVHHPRWVGWRYRAYLKLYKNADAVITLTNNEKSVLARLGVKEDRIYTTGMGPVLEYSAVEPDAFRYKHSIDGPFVLFLGQHYIYKGYQQLLQASKIVWHKFPEVHFVFIGPSIGQSERAFASIKDRRIHRLGSVSLVEKGNALAACSILCVPSTQESFGSVYTEAWYYSKPVIGCNIPTVAEVIDDGVNGFLVSQDAEAIAERLIHLFTNPTLLMSIGAAGKSKVEEQFTWDRIAERTENVYKKVLGITH